MSKELMPLIAEEYAALKWEEERPDDQKNIYDVSPGEKKRRSEHEIVITKTEEEEIEAKEIKKPHTCEECNSAFARKYDLKVHIRRHTKERPYVCSDATCAKSFARSSSVREHERNVHQIYATPRRKRRILGQDMITTPLQNSTV
eukprot:TRINITY_DN2950_c0_g1_i1.p1 TRINITY_DN2950_c0_g1~~TRINITY_DN2950_c0_g1_i1.p1  ORF type:complete len:167 (-),score=19.32 TRINITY_DN2950_c0_g1_i1:53-487(-)